MLGALATYLSGFRYLPARVERKVRAAAAPLTRHERQSVAALIAVMAIVVFAYIAYYQLANVLPVWLEQHADLNAGRVRDPDPLVLLDRSAGQHPVGSGTVRAVELAGAQHGGEPPALSKIAIGSFIAAAANLVLVAAILLSPGRVLWIWPVLYCAIQGVGFMYFWPTLLALVSRAAPAKINATMMGVSFLTLFVANNLIGRIGTYYEKMSPAAFWSLHAAIGAAGGLLMLLFARALGRFLDPQPSALELGASR